MMTIYFQDYLIKDFGSQASVVPSDVNTYIKNLSFGTSFTPFAKMNRHTPGPLMISALSLYGEEGMFYVAANFSDQTYPPIVTQVCQTGNIPFLRLDSDEDQFGNLQGSCWNINSAYQEGRNGRDVAIEEILYEIAFIFDPGTTSSSFASRHLEIAMYFAIEAWLTQTSTAAPVQYTRNIYTSPGMPVNRPVKTLTATIVISALLFAQLLGLLLLVIYIYSVPTWTAALDSQAVANLTKTAGNAIGEVGGCKEKYAQHLKNMDGLVGLVLGEAPINDSRSKSTGQLRLARGGGGVISKALILRRRKLREACS